MNEVWLAVDGLSGRYDVSSFGRVRSLERIDSIGHRVPSRILKEDCSHPKGYRRVSMSAEGKVVRRLVHRIVAAAFLPNETNLAEVNHRDGDPTNNRVDNLEWISSSGNKMHAHYVIKTGCGPYGKARPVIASDGKAEVTYPSMMEARRAGFHSSGVALCCAGKTTMYRGYTWKYAAI